MSEETRNNPARRRLLKVTALAAATTGLYGVAPFFGPWKQHHAWAQTGPEETADDRV